MLFKNAEVIRKLKKLKVTATEVKNPAWTELRQRTDVFCFLSLAELSDLTFKL